MTYFAHATIETATGKYQRGDEVDPKAVEGFDELVEYGSISKDAYDPKKDKSPMPDTVEIEGVRYIKVQDGAEVSSDVQA